MQCSQQRSQADLVSSREMMLQSKSDLAPAMRRVCLKREPRTTVQNMLHTIKYTQVCSALKTILILEYREEDTGLY